MDENGEIVFDTLAEAIDLVDRVEADTGHGYLQLLGDFQAQFINESDGGFSVPYHILYNFSNNADAEPEVDDDFPIAFDADTDYGDLANAEVIDFIGGNHAEGLGPWKNSFSLRESLDEAVDGDGNGVAEITS